MGPKQAGRRPFSSLSFARSLTHLLTDWQLAPVSLRIAERAFVRCSDGEHHITIPLLSNTTANTTTTTTTLTTATTTMTTTTTATTATATGQRIARQSAASAAGSSDHCRRCIRAIASCLLLLVASQKHWLAHSSAKPAEGPECKLALFSAALCLCVVVCCYDYVVVVVVADDDFVIV